MSFFLNANGQPGIICFFNIFYSYYEVTMIQGIVVFTLIVIITSVIIYLNKKSRHQTNEIEENKNHDEIAEDKRVRNHTKTAIEPKKRRANETNAENPNKKTPLCTAIKCEDYQRFQDLIKAKVDINLEDSEGYAPIHYVAMNGCDEMADILIKNNANVNIKANNNGQTSLWFAAHNGRIKIAEMLIEAGANLNIPNNQRETPLFASTIMNNLDVAKLLIEKGADVNIATKDGRTPLWIAEANNFDEIVNLINQEPDHEMHQNQSEQQQKSNETLNRTFFEACKHGRIDEVSKLLNSEFDLNKIVEDCGTPLHVASMNGHKEIVEILIDSGADVHIGNGWGNMTPLHLAARKGQKDIAQMLIKEGIDVDVKDEDGNTPLLEASEYGHKELIQLLIDNGANVNVADAEFNETPLHRASRGEYRATVELLIKEGIDVDVVDIGGRTPLSYAAEYANKGVAEFLIEKGADVNVVSNFSSTPLHEAIGHCDNDEDYRFRDIVDLLIKAGADVDIGMDDGRTPLHLASWKCNKEIVELLIKADADPNVEMVDGRTPKDWVPTNDYEDIVELLISASAKKGRTPDHASSEEAKIKEPENLSLEGIHPDEELFYASEDGNLAEIKAAINSGASPNAHNGTNTALMMAARYGHKEAVVFLLSVGADPNITNSHGGTALSWAKMDENVKTIEILEKITDLSRSKSIVEFPLNVLD